MSTIAITAVIFVTTALLWLVGCDYYRSRPRCSHNVSFILGFAGPLGCIAILVAGIICISYERKTIIRAHELHSHAVCVWSKNSADGGCMRTTAKHPRLWVFASSLTSE